VLDSADVFVLFSGFWMRALFSSLALSSSSAIDCLGRSVAEMPDYVTNSMLKLTNFSKEMTCNCSELLAF